MMNDCQNVKIREALPELVHGALPEAERVSVQHHVAGCDDCAAELAIIRSVLASAPTVAVDVPGIAAAIPQYRRGSAGFRRGYLQLAAACLVGAIGISAFELHQSRSPATIGATASAASVLNGGLVLVNTNDISDAGLAQLTRDLDKLQALPTADPESVTPAALEAASQPATPGDSA